MNNGIIPGEEMKKAYQDLKYGKEKVWVLAINANSLEIVFKGDNTFQYKDLVQHLPAKEPRFVIIDFDYETDECPPRKTSKLIFICWCPVESPPIKRFTYPSAINGIVNTLGAISKTLQCDCYADLDYDVVRKSCLANA